MTYFPVASTTLVSAGMSCRSFPTCLQRKKPRSPTPLPSPLPSRASLDDTVFAVHVCFQLTVRIDYGPAPHQQPASVLCLHWDKSNMTCMRRQSQLINPAVQLTILVDICSSTGTVSQATPFPLYSADPIVRPIVRSIVHAS